MSSIKAHLARKNSIEIDRSGNKSLTHDQLVSHLTATAKLLNSHFDNYYPQRGNNNFAERNLTTAFVRLLPKQKWLVFSEASFEKRRGQVDTVAIDLVSKSLVVIEATAHRNKFPIDKLCLDLNRLSEFNLAKAKSSPKLKMRSRYGVLLISTWSENAVKQWKGIKGGVRNNMRKLSAALTKVDPAHITGVLPLIKSGYEGEKCWLLYAIIEL